MKEQAKAIARGLARIAILPLYVGYRIQRLVCSRRRAFSGYSQLLSLAPGLIGEYLRREFYRLTLTRCAKSVVISFGTVLATDEVELDENVYVGNFCVLGNVAIGKDTLLASRVSVVSGTRQHGTQWGSIPIREQEGSFLRVSIGEDCWIGEGAVLAADIGPHSIVGAGSVVIKAIGEGSLAFGNPAICRPREPAVGDESKDSAPARDAVQPQLEKH